MENNLVKALEEIINEGLLPNETNWFDALSRCKNIARKALSAQPVNEGVEKAAEEYGRQHSFGEFIERQEAFIAGAQWLEMVSIDTLRIREHQRCLELTAKLKLATEELERIYKREGYQSTFDVLEALKSTPAK